MVARVGPLIPRPAVSIRTAYSDYRTRFARFMLITTATTTINKELRCLIGRLHRATGLHTGMHTGFANQASKHCLRIWPRPLASLRKQYLQPADGRGQHVLIYIYNK